MLASLGIVLAATALFVLLPGAKATIFAALLLGYLAAIVVSLPGIDRASLFAALLAYRVVYYLIPLAIGMLLFGIHALRAARVRSA